MLKQAVGLFVSSCALGAEAGAASLFRGQDNNPAGTGALASYPTSTAAEASFLAAVGTGVSTFGFESFATGTVPGTWQFGDGLSAAYANEATVANSISTGVSAVHTYPLDGTKYLYTETRPGAGFFTLTFNRELTGFGMYVTDASDWFGNSNIPGPLFVELLNAQGQVLETHDLTSSIPPAQLLSGNVAYFGVISDAPFVKVRLAQPLRQSGASTSSDGIGIDRISVVPGPATGLIALLGAAGAARRRR